MKDLRLVVLSGPSGSGKSTAIKALEDAGFFCVDNMPTTLLPRFISLLDQSAEILRAAVVIDVRAGEFLKDYTEVLSGLRDEGYPVETLFFDATDDILVRRFSETRRRHPLATSEGPLTGIAIERELLSEIRGSAERVIDTSSLTVHQLRDLLKDLFAGPAGNARLAINIISFGYRYGIPVESDMVVDVRFLPNPHFIDSLRPLSGTDSEVIDFVLGREETGEFLKRIEAFLSYLIPLYWKEGKSYLTIAIGCTGGRHRSVVIADHLASEMVTDKGTLRCKHRDKDKG